MKDDVTKKLQKVEMEILNYFVEICEKNNLKYYLAYGTLIGAIRHNGFIPWDDDIDVFMPLDDYYKLAKIMEKENNDKYFFQSFNTEIEYNQIWYKIRKNNTIMEESISTNLNYHKGIFIDIFPLIPKPNEKKLSSKQEKQFKIVTILLQNNMPFEFRRKHYGLLGLILSQLASLLPRKYCIKKVNKLMKKICSYDSNFESYFGLWDKNFSSSSFRKSIFHEFEGNKFLIPEGYDLFLKEVYGDYMQLPPVEKRYNHSPIKIDFGDSDEN